MKRERKRLKFGGRALARYIALVRRTSRLVVEPEDAASKDRLLKPQIFAMWHGQFLPIPSLYNHQGLPVDVMVARHGDAEIIGEAVSKFGMSLIRGAGAGSRKRDRGGSAALRASVRALSSQRHVAMTADIPPGPARVAGMGIVMLARLSGRPITPVAVATNRFVTFDTWSRMTVNLPYSRMAMVTGDQIDVPADADKQALEAARLAVETELNRVTRRAYELVGADPLRATPHNALPRDTPALRAGLRLRLYRTLTAALGPITPLILGYRGRFGKEDSTRRDERLGRRLPQRPQGRIVWFHAASVGETNAVLPVIARIRGERPDRKILLTTGTRTSADLAQKRLPEDAIHQYIPIDTPAAVAGFLDHWKPELAVLTESELWPNLMMACAERQLAVVLINARMSNRSFKRWRRYKRLSHQLMSRLSLVLAQNERLARRFQTLGARRVLGVGNLKVDSPPLPVDQSQLAALRQTCGARHILLAASTHAGEDEIVLAAHKILKPDLGEPLTIIVPRHPERGEDIARLATQAGLTVTRRSLGQDPDPSTDVYIADTIGELGLFYRLAPCTFIGGSLIPHGGQNPIEAIREGCAVLTGPHVVNFADAYTALKQAGGAVEVIDAQTLADAFSTLLSSDTDLQRVRSGAAIALEQLSGALELTVKELLEFLPEDESLKRAS